MRCVVTNWPSGHSVSSSTSTLPPPSWIRRVPHGSGTHAPSMAPDLNVSSVCALSCGTTDTSPPPCGVGLETLLFQPIAQRHVLRVAELRRRDLLALEVSGRVDLGLDHEERTARCGAGDDADRLAVRLAKALIAGFGPMYVASSAPAKIAVTTSGPALKVFVSSLLAPSFSAKIPFSTPTIAVAWVTFGK